ncbi:MAG: hypothetical protein HC827_11375 [Cyanobacteria bacterium RM1_2_2]|nr:hypothetical protein [Cyanobacteria bacterium RM1_2_2]
MLDEDNQPNNDQFDDNQPEDAQRGAPRSAARRRAVCQHTFKKVGSKRVCSKCGLKVSSGKPS